jgi:endonuclease/exonuclease/phosphatase family metal-dependent hydrolase
VRTTKQKVAWSVLGACGVAAAVLVALRLRAEPEPAPAPPPADTPLKVITYNVQFLPGPGRLFNKRANAEYRARTLGGLLAAYDVIGLNEVFDDTPRRLLTEGLRAELGDAFHCVTAPDGERSAFGVDSGLMLVSRLPVVARHSLRYGNDSSPLKHGFLADGFAAKGALHARLSRGPDAPADDCLDVFVTHLESREAAVREKQYAQFAGFVREHSGPGHPALLLGDFNTDGGPRAQQDPRSAYHRLLAALRPRRDGAEVRDLWPLLSKGPGGTSDQETDEGGKRIDYIFLANPAGARPLRPQRVRVNRFLDGKVKALSDHSAVEAELEWAGARVSGPG